MLGPVLRKVLVVNFYSKGKIMNIKLTSLIASVALLSGVSVANAEGPLQLTEASMDGITAGSGYHHYPATFEFTKYINTDVKHMNLMCTKILILMFMSMASSQMQKLLHHAPLLTA